MEEVIRRKRIGSGVGRRKRTGPEGGEEEEDRSDR